MNQKDIIDALEQYHTAEKEGEYLVDNYSAWDIEGCAKEALEQINRNIRRIYLQRSLKNRTDLKYPSVFKAKFNNAICVVHPTIIGASEILVSDWKAEMKRQAEEYLRSPEYAERQRKNEEEVKAIQEEVDSLVKNLPNILENLDKTYLLRWLIPYTEKTDRSGVNGHYNEVISLLEKAGYQNNRYVGDPEAKTDLTKGLHWLVGQVINCMKTGMPPHPVTIAHAEKLLAEMSN